VIDEIPDCSYLWMFATGTGVGPFLSILKTRQPWQRFEKIVLAYSVRSRDELAYMDLLAELQDQHDTQFCFVPLLTRDVLPSALNLRIPAALEAGVLEARAGIPLAADTSHVMMCGNSGMIADVSELLTGRGLRRHRRREPGHITTEKYH
jgi:ferredoxin--NADP+ reductase